MITAWQISLIGVVAAAAFALTVWSVYGIIVLVDWLRAKWL